MKGEVPRTEGTGRSWDFKNLIMPKFHNIALRDTETTGETFHLNAGYHLFAAGLPDGNTFPAWIKLQMRFKDETGENVPWFDTGTQFTESERTDVVLISPNVELRMLASAAGAVIHHSEIKISSG